MRASLLLLGIAVFLTACTAGPSQQQIENADYGEPPENSTRLAEGWIRERLIDPESARFQHAPLVKGYATYTDGLDTKVVFGWLQCGSVNAKNRMGGYAGSKPYFVIIKDDEIAHGHLQSPDNLNQSYVQDTCNNILEEKPSEGRSND